MKNIVDYVSDSGGQTINERAFNDVDALILSQLAYLKYDGIVPGIEGKQSINIAEIKEHQDVENLFAETMREKENRALFEAVAKSNRFGNMKLNYYVNIVDVGWEIQFSAVMFIFPGDIIYVAFRGTDETFVGWKEDFNMGFLAPVPAQEKALQYLNIVTDFFAGNFIVGGHSKGGNLSVYAAMNCKDAIRNRISKVYSLDGPGFREEILLSSNYDAISDKVSKILPHSSVVGMILQQQEKYDIIECRSVGLFQHNPYNWIVSEDGFKKTEKFGEGTRLFNESLNEWASSMNKEQFQEFVEALYKIIGAAEADNLIDLTRDWKKNTALIIAALKDMDDHSKEMIKLVIKSLLKIINHTVKKELPLATK